MAWWSLYKWFATFRTFKYENIIEWYSGKLFKEWYESLSEEERGSYNKKQKERKRKNDEAFADLMSTYAKIINRTAQQLMHDR